MNPRLIDRIIALAKRARIAFLLSFLLCAALVSGVFGNAGSTHAQDSTPVLLTVPTLTATPEIVISLTPSRTPTPLVSAVRVEAKDAATGANLRAGPGTDTDKVGNIRPGQFFPALGRFREWTLIQYGGGTAWVYKEVVNYVGGTFESLTELAELPTSNVLNQGTVGAQSTASAVANVPGGELTATALRGSATGVRTVSADGTITSDNANIPQETFTFAPPVIEATLPARATVTTRSGFPPAIIIVALLAIGVAGLVGSIVRSLLR